MFHESANYSSAVLPAWRMRRQGVDEHPHARSLPSLEPLGVLILSRLAHGNGVPLLPPRPRLQDQTLLPTAPT